ncbi:hypothetical protein ATANTOWER_027626 [Ataeniobius toweri]|uniref:Uncharacterized protein n=1 Tax=Ataeniobius toweri TaxID=208326 RepID=A0ABU7C102_9TELE|nr:hypothetical protein [Ataeniobius toweri]
MPKPPQLLDAEELYSELPADGRAPHPLSESSEPTEEANFCRLNPESRSDAEREQRLMRMTCKKCIVVKWKENDTWVLKYFTNKNLKSVVYPSGPVLCRTTFYCSFSCRSFGGSLFHFACL